ncbi:conserved hypothetical protein [Mesorhizobium escarrei]|uniref:Uncharacterized protein n=1 Tax=Mesorhizobium escarrei TaxID=666018 RepID=A0ABM9DNC2_9HYPH|nr:conserved hypothetical protein [Mesorhizobium escarrei]
MALYGKDGSFILELQRLMFGKIIMQHLATVSLFEREATDRADSKCSASSFTGGPSRLPLIPVAGLLVLSRLTLIVRTVMGTARQPLRGRHPTGGPNRRGVGVSAGWDEQ